MRNLHCSYDFSNSHSKSNSAKHLMGGACLKPGFWIRTGLTVQLHQILPISRRRQGLYKDCPHHRDNAFHILPLSPDGFLNLHMPSHPKNSHTHFFLLLMRYLSVSRVCSEGSRCESLITEQPFPPSRQLGPAWTQPDGPTFQMWWGLYSNH